MARKHIPAVGISLTVAAYFILSLFSALNKYVQELGYPTSQVMFFDGLVGLICMVAVSAQQGELKGLRLQRPMQGLLMVVNVAAAFLIFPAYPHLPLLTAYLIAFTGPLMITILSAVFLKEKITWQQGAAVLAGFGAAAYSMVATQGDALAVAFDPAQLPYILRLFAGTFLFATTQVMVRKLSDTESTWSFPFFYYSGMFLLAGLFFHNDFIAPQAPRDWALLLSLGVLDAFSLAMIYLGLKYAKASTVVPFQYSAMIWVILLDLVLWGKAPATVQLAGAVVLVAAGIYIATHERKLAKKARK
ncbi:MAG TPA: DMT family transporter [Patescibacteria group bacterium]|nr:DMT family transporter [Patescibacteria group bacterium]